MLYKVVITLLFSMFIFTGNAFAHPGRTDANGGHYCWTNCGQWGLSYGEYHYHDGSGGTYTPPNPPTYNDTDYDTGYEEGYQAAYDYTSECVKDYQLDLQGTESYRKGYKAGKEAGHFDGLEVCYEDSYEAGKQEGESESQEGIAYNEDRTIDDTYDKDSYLKGYAAGYDKEAYNEAVASENQTKSDEENTKSVVESVTASQKSKKAKQQDNSKDSADVSLIQLIAAPSIIIGIVAISVAHDFFRYRKK